MCELLLFSQALIFQLASFLLFFQKLINRLEKKIVLELANHNRHNVLSQSVITHKSNKIYIISIWASFLQLSYTAFAFLKE